MKTGMGDEQHERPLAEQVAANRHDIAGLRTQLALLFDKLQGLADRQALLETSVGALPYTEDLLEALIGRVMDRRADANRAERAKERAELKKTMKRWALAFLVGAPAVTTVIDKMGHWVRFW